MATSMSTASLTTQTTLSAINRRPHASSTQSPAAGPRDDAKIEKGAREFEAMLLTTWLQQAEQSMATVPGAEDDEDAAWTRANDEPGGTVCSIPRWPHPEASG